METFNLDLVFFPSVVAGPSVAVVQVKQSGGQNYGGQQYDDLISCECFSYRELDAEINRLQAELEEIRKKGNQKFSEAA
jgi:hypothetical protein